MKCKLLLLILSFMIMACVDNNALIQSSSLQTRSSVAKECEITVSVNGNSVEENSIIETKGVIEVSCCLDNVGDLQLLYVQLMVEDLVAGKDWGLAVLQPPHLSGSRPYCSDSYRIYKPGIYNIHAIGYFSNGVNEDDVITIESNLAELSLTYPSSDDILSKLGSDMDDAWRRTKQFPIKEYGFYIYVKDGVLEAGDYAEGADYDCPSYYDDDTTTTLQGEETAYGSDPTLQGDQRIAGIFHTHPPLVYCGSNVDRVPGPSWIDISGIEQMQSQVPGFVYDYEGTKIRGGHPLDASAKIYTYGPECRNNQIE